MISNAIIGINLYAYKIDHSQKYIMSTYYVGQFLITLTGVKAIVDEKEEKAMENKNDHNYSTMTKFSLN